MLLVGVYGIEAQMLNSFVFVPLWSPRLAKVDCVAEIALSASLELFIPPIFAGSLFGPTRMKSLYMTSKRSLA